MLAQALEKANSCYWPSLQNMFSAVTGGEFRDVVEAASNKESSPQHRPLPVLGLEEANDVSLHLQPLQALLEEMEHADYSQVSDRRQNNQAQPGGHIWGAAEPQRPQRGHNPWLCCSPDQALLLQLRLFVPKVLSTVCLLRVHCMHYHSPAHIARILQEICNFFISLVQPQGQHSPTLSAPAASLGHMWRCRDTLDQGTAEPHTGLGRGWGRHGLQAATSKCVG